MKCPFCGRESETLEEVEIFLNDEPLSKMTVCPDCAALMNRVSEQDDFGQQLVEFIKNLSENWEEGTKDNVKVGSIIKILEMKDEPIMNYANKTGVVEHIDDIGQLHGTWSGLAVIPGVDKFLVLKE